MPTAPLDQYGIESEIVRFVGMLEEETEQFAIVARDHAKKEAIHKSNWAKAYLAADGAVAQRTAWADWQTKDSLFDVKLAEALTRAKREKLASIRTNLDSLRTLSANVRAMT